MLSSNFKLLVLGAVVFTSFQAPANIRCSALFRGTPNALTRDFVRQNADGVLSRAIDKIPSMRLTEWTPGVYEQFEKFQVITKTDMNEALNLIGKLASVFKQEGIYDLDGSRYLGNKEFSELMYFAEIVKIDKRTTPEVVALTRKIKEFQSRNSEVIETKTIEELGRYGSSPVSVRTVAVVRFPSFTRSLSALIEKKESLEPRELKETREVTLSNVLTEEGLKQSKYLGTFDPSKLGF